MDLDPTAAKFDAIEKFDSTLGKVSSHDVDLALFFISGVNAWANSVNSPNKSVQSIEFEAVKKFDSSISHDNYRNGHIVVNN